MLDQTKSLPSGFTNPKTLNVGQLANYETLFNSQSKEKVYLKFSNNTEDSSAIHLIDELKTKIAEYVTRGAKSIVILYDMQRVKKGDVEKWVVENIEKDNQKASKLKNTTERTEKLSAIDNFIAKQLEVFPNNSYLYYERAVNRSYAKKLDEAAKYLQKAAFIAISKPDSTDIFRAKLEFESNLKLQILIASRKTVYESVINALKEKDVSLIDIELHKPAQVSKDGLYFINFNSQVDQYTNSKQGYRIVIHDKDQQNNIVRISVYVSDSPGATKEYIYANNVSLAFGSNIPVNPYLKNWTVKVINYTPNDVKYVRLGTLFEYTSLEQN